MPYTKRELYYRDLAQYYAIQSRDHRGPADPSLCERVAAALKKEQERILGKGLGMPEAVLLELSNATRRVGKPEPLDWAKLTEATKGAPKQFELIRVLVNWGDWIELSELADLVWGDPLTKRATVVQLIKRANETLRNISARVHIRPDDDRVIADIL